MPTEHFKTEGDYQRWNAYRHIHGIPAPNLKTAIVAGKPHKVKHSDLSLPEIHAQGKKTNKAGEITGRKKTRESPEADAFYGE